MFVRFVLLLSASMALPAFAADPSASTEDRFGPADLARLASVTEPALSPDGEFIAYTVSTADTEADKSSSDLWRARYDGSERIRLTSTRTYSEWRPRWSPDGRWLAFLSDRGDEGASTQVWMMPARRGEAHKFTDLPGGVSDFDWAPDSKHLALIAPDPETEPGAAKPKHAPPIVIDRYQFKDDDLGYLGTRRKHLYLYDLSRNKAEPLTTGAHDEQLPAWSPDGKWIAYVTKRGDDPDRSLNYDIYLVEPKAGAKERRLTAFPGSDLDPYWESRPAWSPDSKRIAYLQGGEDRDIYYAPWQLAVIDVANGKVTLPAPIDRCFYKPRWSADGKSVYTLIERNLVTNAARVELASGRITTLDPGPRFDYDLDVSKQGRVVVLGGTDTRPYEISAVEPKALRQLTDHNAFLAQKELAPAEEIRFESKDGTDIEALLVKPPGYEPGKRYPAVLRLHGGPVYQFSHEFLPDFQALAAAGYVVIGPNPRGSSGRGLAFARAIRADWGHKDVEDVLAAVDHVASLGIVDAARLGVGGRSYGGILTNYVIASDPRFKAAVSGAGSANAYGMYGHDMYTREVELELGLPWKDREVFDRVSYAFLHADRIVTPTQYYCAEKDFNVPCQGSEQMYQALRSRNVPTQFVIYPGEHHAMVVPSYLRDRMERALGWYGKYLGTGAAGAAAEPAAGSGSK